MEPRRPQALQTGLFLLVVGLPLAILPLARQPFADPKLVVLLLGTLLVWSSGTTPDRRIAIVAAVWGSTCVVAALAGVDAAASVLGPWDSTGVLLLLACAALVAVGPAIPAPTWDRASGWLVWAAVVVAGVAVAWRLAPDVADSALRDLSLRGSTLGNPVFAVALLSAAIPAAVASSRGERWLTGVLVVIASGLAANGERSSLIMPAVALVTCVWPLRERRRTAIAAVAIVATIGAWGLTSSVLPDAGLEQAGKQLTTLAGEQHRLAVWTANARSVGERPAFGWGPGLAWSAFVSSATAEELDVAGRGWGDAHSLPLQLLVTTGIAGLLAFALLAWRVLPGLVRPRPAVAWVAASAIVLGAFSMYEPLNVAVTPLLFLFAGGANAERPRAARRSASAGLRPALAPTVALCLGAGLVVSGVALVASSLEQWSRTHFEPAAIRASVRVMPWRLSATERFAIELALDGRAGDDHAAGEARRVIAEAVDDHPWDPGVRLIAADVEMLLRNPDGVRPWLDDHLERFPNDVVAVPEDPAADTVPAG